MKPSLAYRITRVVSIIVILFVMLLPIFWMLLSSFKTNVQIYDVANAFNFEPTLDNYRTVFERSDYPEYIWNSFFIAFVSTLISMVIAVPAAYVMSRFSMKRSALVVLAARIIPAVSLLVPWYYIFSNLRLVGGYSVLILSHMFVSLPLILYIMIGFFDGLPIDLEEAAQVDGLTPIGAFLRMTLPLSIPGLATSGILSFIFSWNNFMFALVLSDAHTKTLPVAIYDFIGYASIDWGGLMAASTVVTLPIMVIALFAQRYVVSGLTAGAVKG